MVIVVPPMRSGKLQDKQAQIEGFSLVGQAYGPWRGREDDEQKILDKNGQAQREQQLVVGGSIARRVDDRDARRPCRRGTELAR